MGGTRRQQQQQQRSGIDVSAVQKILETRACGSPAVDGYAHVKPECLEASPTNQWWQVGPRLVWVGLEWIERDMQEG